MQSRNAKFVSIIAIFLLISTFVCFGQAGNGNGEAEKEKQAPPPPTYILGNQNLIISLGPFIPLFFTNFADGSIEAANLYVGVKLGLQWQSYLTNELSIGIEVNGSLSLSPNFNILWLLPLGIKGTYTIHAFPLEIPLSLTMGICLESYLESTRTDFFAKPEVAVYWKFDPAWAVGINISYWLIPQAATKEQEDVNSGQSFLGNFLEVSAGFSFHF